jgi:hypothetical protein
MVNGLFRRRAAVVVYSKKLIANVSARIILRGFRSVRCREEFGIAGWYSYMRSIRNGL